jgi:hypothetical protein
MDYPRVVLIDRAQHQTVFQVGAVDDFLIGRLAWSTDGGRLYVPLQRGLVSLLGRDVRADTRFSKSAVSLVPRISGAFPKDCLRVSKSEANTVLKSGLSALEIIGSAEVAAQRRSAPSEVAA